MNNKDLDLQKLYLQFLTLKNDIEEHLGVKCLIQYSIMTEDGRIAAGKVNSIDLHEIELEAMEKKIEMLNNIK